MVDAAGGAPEPSLDAALSEFLADRGSHVSARTLDKYQNVIDTLRWSINWYAGEKLTTIPARDLPDHLGSFFETLVHKEFAAPSRLRTAKTVLVALLRWLHASGYLDSTAVQSGLENVQERIGEYTERIDEYIEIREFVDALRALATHAVHPEFGADRVSDQYLRITKTTDDSITFAHWDGQAVGPITVPPDVAEMARPGWQILLSAACIDGEWHLLEVVNGDP